MDRKIKYLTIAGIMAALITLMTAYICHIPMGANGAYIHFGDTLIYLAAALLPKPYALAAAAIGGGLADLLTAPMWAPATIIIKMLLVMPFTSNAPKVVVPRNVIATIIGYLFTGVGYFLAEYIMFENPAVIWVSMSQNLVQSVGSAVLFVVFGAALDKVHIKNKIF